MATPRDEPKEALPVSELTPEEANRIIYSHRKVRYGTACWPCRQRKVKCDNQHPCDNCVKRDHSHLCSYKPNRPSAAGRNSSAASLAGQARKRARTASEGNDVTPKSDRQDGNDAWTRALGMPPNEDDSDHSAGDRYLGQNSIPALLREQSTPISRGDGIDIRRDMRSILGLDTSAPFPLMSQHHLRCIAQDISSQLPSDREVMKLFRTYKEIPHPFWGFIADIDELEAKLMVYLEDRSRSASDPGKSSRPVTASWLAILFSVLAVGAQYHESPYHIRTRDSQKYIQISFHLLRLGNFLLRPSFESIQALLLTGFVLLNDMKAEASWALTGLTCRLAQSLGLHRPSAGEASNEGTPLAPESKEMIKRRLWWTCVWHDTLTSLSFDRSPMTNFPCCPIPLQVSSSPNSLTYLETLYHLIEIISRRLNPDSMANATYKDIIDNCEAVENLRKMTCPHIRYKEQCKSAMDRLQHFAVRLHTSFLISVACRPALRQDVAIDPAHKEALAHTCKLNLSETVRMFLAMHQLSVIPTRSWAFTYHGLSSALLLGIIADTKTDPEVRQLQGDLIAALSATAAKDVDEPGVQHVVKTDKDIELSGPLSRALTALKNIYENGSIDGSNLRRSGSGQRTPLPAVVAAPTFVPGRGLDPREDAALTMAEMQNGCIDVARRPDTPTAIGMDMMGVDMQYMAPMDIYESIWIEPPADPWSGGVDQFGLGFVAQPPPGQPQQQFYF